MTDAPVSDEQRQFWIVIFDGSAWDTQEQAEKHLKDVCDGSLIYHVAALNVYAVDAGADND